MNTWAAHAALAHATLPSGIGPAPALGSVSLYSFALGASVTVLALLIVRSPKQLSLRWRSGDPARRVTRPGRLRQAGTAQMSSVSEPDDAVLESVADTEPPCALDQASIRRTSRLRQRLDLILLQMLGDDDDQPLAPG